jgi:16S rRNA (adenine1518-N6/adenine1519-N6)-dimethyltransferase
MPLYRPTELQAFLASCGISPKKSLSQNFLVDGNILMKIAALAAVSKDDIVLEIGPGPGALTEHLLEHGCEVVAIEKDTVFANALLRLQNADNKLQVLEADFLEFDILQLAKKRQKKIKIIANIPYSLTTAIIEKIIASYEAVSSATLMVQEEVAQKLCATNGEQIGALTLLLQYHAKTQYGFIVPPKCFYPPPAVHSAVFRFDIGKASKVPNEELFFTAIRTAFQQRRKTIKASLKKLFDSVKIEQALQSISKSPMARPQELSIREWIQLFYACTC